MNYIFFPLSFSCSLSFSTFFPILSSPSLSLSIRKFVHVDAYVRVYETTVY